MKKLKKYFSFPRQIFLAIFLVVLSFSFLFTHQLLAEDDPGDKLKDLHQKIQEYEQKIEDLQGEQRTLASTISYLNNKIQLTATQIAATEQELEILVKEIASLSGKIEILDKSISDVSTILSSRIEATYKRGKIKSVYLFFSSQGFSEFLSRIQYLKVAQLHDRQLLFEMQESKMNYDSQKELKEEKQAEQERLQKQLISQKVALARQKEEKAVLLEKTKNDEQRYQEMLTAARAEMEAIQSIIAGQGEETEVGDINEGERIASIIVGSSACSTGTHLHFEISAGGAHANPEKYLKSISLSYAYDTSKIPETMNPHGSWNWPMNEPITITQIYGMSYWARVFNYYNGGPHTGVDVQSPNLFVKAVKNGVLYRGSIACGGGTLRYVKVDHQDSDIDTYYVHVNYY